MPTFLSGDQKAGCHFFLKHIFCLKENLMLSSFLTHVSIAIREEIIC